MINNYGHPDADLLIPSVREALPAVRTALSAARKGGAEVIYVNDNFGRWRSHHDELLDTVLQGPHADLVAPITPDENSLRHQGAPFDLLRDPAGVSAAAAWDRPHRAVRPGH
jgi:hypothetical protein